MCGWFAAVLSLALGLWKDMANPWWRARQPPAQAPGLITITEDGIDRPYYFHGSSSTQDSRGVVLHHGEKFYLMNKDVHSSPDPEDFKRFRMDGKSVAVTVDFGPDGPGCGCNAAFFLVSMPAGAPGEAGDWYCDANGVGGNWCPEFDLFEANTHAIQTTSHPCDPDCDRGGHPVAKFFGGDFGPGARVVDTGRPFTVTVEFVPVAGSTNELYCHLNVTQGRSWLFRDLGPVNRIWGPLSQGMVLTLVYWSSQDLTWLDGDTCHQPESCNQRPVVFSNISISQRWPPVARPGEELVQI